MPSYCGACGLTFNKSTEVVKCTGKCGLHYHSVCTNLRTQQDITMLIQNKIEWVCNFCRSYTGNKNVKNINGLSLLNRKSQPNISDQVRSLLGEFGELQTCVDELLKNIDKLGVAINNMNKTKHNETNRVTKRLRSHDKETNNYVKNLTLDVSGIQESEGGFHKGNTNVPQFCSKDTSAIIEDIAETLKIHVYLLAVLILVFVISKIYAG
jgi:hypothetical protein